MKTASQRNKQRPASTSRVLPQPDAVVALAVSLGIALFSSPAAAVSPAPPPAALPALQSAEALWNDCGQTPFGPVPQLCSAYVVGASDGALAAASPSPPFCLAGDVQADQLAQAVRRYMSAHPQVRARPAAAVVAAALRAAYPCGEVLQR